jgi:hypothetical protein
MKKNLTPLLLAFLKHKCSPRQKHEQLESTPPSGQISFSIFINFRFPHSGYVPASEKFVLSA